MNKIFYHLKEHRSSDSHPVELDLKGGVEGEVSVVIAAAPLHAVAAVVDVHIQGDHFLLRDGGGCDGSKGGRDDGGRADPSDQMFNRAAACV